jgi:hypothetical protein
VRYLLDTNVLLRLALHDEAANLQLTTVVEHLRTEGAEVCCTAQAIREVWHVSTRTVESNGLGLSLDATEKITDRLRSMCTLLLESEASFTEWRRIVVADGGRGAATHDANQMAIAAVEEVDYVLTYDLKHFRNFESAGVPAIGPTDVKL